ncbi:MAG TPA: radical SAM protein [Thermodesulfobacteriota bacterium]|nr:radical SAM protein [Thermodesulfobacteriota bacterium]
MSARLRELDSFFARFPHLPPEAILKEDLLRSGLRFDRAALREAAGHKPKSYFIFSFDHAPLAEMPEETAQRPPEEIALEGGPLGLRRTVVSVRLNPRSPYLVAGGDGGERLLVLEGRPLARVHYPTLPAYYRRQLASGKPVLEIAPTIEWGYLIYLTVFRLCQYFGEELECRFCDMNENYRQQRAAGRPYTGVKRVEEVLEALEIIAAAEPADSPTAARAYTVTGGSVLSQVDGLAEGPFYARYVEAIEARFPGRWIGKVVAQALPLADVRRFKAAGARIYHPNYEVWDPDLFRTICPGKARYIGRDEWIRRILDAAEIFGPRYVIPNFVAGIELARPYGFATVDEAIASTAEGLDFFMARGITPRFTTWCPEPLTPLGRQNPDGAPLEYHVRLLDAYRAALARHGLRPPPGYGPAGVGRAVFSVSAFMDVLEPDGEGLEPGHGRPAGPATASAGARPGAGE